MGHGILENLSKRDYDGGIVVRSAGTWARKGSPATREAIATAKAAGIDISRHQASPMNRELAQWADVIVTMTDEQAAEVAETDSTAVAKTFTLKELVALLDQLPAANAGSDREGLLARVAEAHRMRSEGRAPTLADREVADPLGLSETVYRAVAHELDELLGRLVVGLLGRPDPALANQA